MPWDITIVNGRERQLPLGERDDVIARVAAALPGIIFGRPPGLPADVIAQTPAVLRAHFQESPRLVADFVAGGISTQFYTDDEPLIRTIGVEVRGDGNPVPVLAAVCQPNGWAAVNGINGEVVDLSANESPAWEQFVGWRDAAVESLRAFRPGDNG